MEVFMTSSVLQKSYGFSKKKKLLITDKEYIDINKIHSNNLD